MTDRLLIDECLSASLVAVAKTRGVIAEYGPHIGKGGWSDWRLVAFAVNNDYVIVTNNRRDFFERICQNPAPQRIDRHCAVRRA